MPIRELGRLRLDLAASLLRMSQTASVEKNLNRIGIFWLPDHPEDRVVGVIDFDSDESRVVLRLHGGFEADRRPVFSPGDIFHDDVYGILQNPGEECSLHGVALMFPGHNYSMAYVNGLVLGDHVRSSDHSSCCRFSMPLGQVVGDVNRAIRYTDHDELVAAHEVRRPVVVEFEAAGAHVSIRSGSTIRHRFDEQVTEYGVAHRVDVSVDGALAWSEMPEQVVAPLRHLVALLTTFQPPIDHFSFDQTDADKPHLNTRQSSRGDRTEDGAPSLGLSLVFPGWQRGGAPSGRHERYSSHFTHLLNKAGVTSTQAGLSRWWTWARLSENDAVLQAANRTAPLRVRTPRDEFSDAVAGLEMLGDRLSNDAAAHRERCDRLAALIPNDDPDRDWAIERLRSGGRLGLTTKLKKMREQCPGGEDLIGDDATIKSIVVARGRLSHGKREQERFQLRYVAQQLREFLVIAAVTEAPTPVPTASPAPLPMA